MSNNRIRIGLLFGGKSAEHEVSVRSARNVYQALDKTRYEVVLIGIDQEGVPHLVNEKQLLAAAFQATVKDLVPSGGAAVSILPGGGQESPLSALDVVFPILHGPLGEDGTVQGFLKLLGIPFVGCGVLASAVGMDKDIMKRLLRDAGIPSANFIVFAKLHVKAIDLGEVIAKLKLPIFVKPANLGSSVGISKARSEKELKAAIDLAFQYDRKALLEETIVGREIECAVLGNHNPQAALPGEVIPSAKHGFYSYEAKYLDENGAGLEIPAKLSNEIIKRVQALAIKTYQVLGCEGMARVDMFVTPDERILVNEVNTIPGFTNISMYPKMWAASGLSYSALIDRLIELALERGREEQALKTTA